MQNSLIRKGLIVGLIVLFIGAGVLPSISGNIDGDSILFNNTVNLNENYQNYSAITEDQFPDLAVMSFAGSICVLLGDGTGGFEDFQEYEVGNSPADMVVGDYDKDGILDLAVTNGADNDVSVLLGDGNGGFGNRQDYLVGEWPVGVTSDDFDLDGNLDLAVTNTVDDDVSVLLGDGTGGFGNRQDYDVGNTPSFMISDDFNLDEFPDLAIANRDDNDVTVLLGDGSGGFGDRQDYPVGFSPVILAAGDFNSDDDLDLAVTNTGDYDVSVLLGDGSGGFGDRQDYSVGTAPIGIICEDFNMDEDLDLAVANFIDNDVSVLLGDGSGGFGDRMDYPVGQYPAYLAVGNFNYRKDPDLECDGELVWSDIKPGDTVYGNFTVINVGDSGSFLDWDIAMSPSWGEWTFYPESGEDLIPEDGPVIVNVEVVAPDEQNEEFTGEIKVINKDDSNDFEIISVSLSTPKNKISTNPLILGWLERFPILQKLLGFFCN